MTPDAQLLSVSTSASALLQVAGWTAERKMEVTRICPRWHPAHAVLEALSGLVLRPAQSAGAECATSTIEFKHVDASEDGQLLGESIGALMIGIANLDDGHAVLLMSSDGACFGSSTVHDACYFLGQNLGASIELLLAGIKPKPLLVRGQKTVTLYGKTYDASDPDLYVP